jgi:hypothetical protein
MIAAGLWLLVGVFAMEPAFGNESVQNRLPRTPRLRGRTFESHVECETRSKTKRDPELPCETSGIVRYDSGYRLSDARVASYERRPGGILGSCGGTGRSLPWCHPVLKRDSVSASLLPFGAIFSGVHWFLPDAEILWKDALAGGIATALLFTGGKSLIGLYLGNSDVTDVYGAAGSLTVILFWTYHSAMILLWVQNLPKYAELEVGAMKVRTQDVPAQKSPSARPANASCVRKLLVPRGRIAGPRFVGFAEITLAAAFRLS